MSGEEKEAMNPSMGIMAGKGSEGSGVGKETWRTWVVLTISWMVW